MDYQNKFREDLCINAYASDKNAHACGKNRGRQVSKMFMIFFLLVHYKLMSLSFKGPVSGFVGRIPLPSLESRINRNH